MLIQKLLSHVRKHGFAKTVYKAVAFLASPCWQVLYRNHVEALLEFDLSAPPLVVPAARLIVRDLVSSDIEALRRFIRQHNVHATYALKRLAYNLTHEYRGVIAVLDGEIVGYGWWMDQTHSHPAQRLHDIWLGEEEIYSFDLFVAPRHRGHHIALEFVIRGQDLVRERGCKRIVSTVLETNRRSILVHHQAGFREFGRHRVHTFLNLVLLCGRKVILRNPLWF